MVHLLVSYLLFKYFIRLMRLTFAAVIGQQTVTGDKGINVSVGMLLQEGDMNRKEV